MQIEYSKSAVKAINSMDKSTKQKIKKGIEGLTTKPPTGDIKPMQGLVLAWDNDFTKLTPIERQKLELAEDEIAKGETVSHNDINWE